MSFTVIHGDCLEVLRGMADNSVDAIVTDPPYGLSFMGNRWDYDVPSVEIWAECLRVLKPGGHLLAFAGTRTQHRMAVRIEDAGFEIRDMIAWLYGSGFPKSLDVSKAIDKAAGAEREIVATETRYNEASGIVSAGRVERTLIERKITAPATDAARQWQGWGTALKPALEPITVARKPLTGTVAENVLAHGTGALNIDGCRVGSEARHNAPAGNSKNPNTATGPAQVGGFAMRADFEGTTVAGRWPANVIHDGSDEVLAGFPQAGGGFGVRGKGRSVYGGGLDGDTGQVVGYGDTGSAARFYYCAKASKRDRDEGLDGFAEKSGDTWGEGIGHASGASVSRRNSHPTVKPTDLMRYLCRLVTPPGGTVLDPFTGSGSTGKAALLEGFSFIGIEREAEYVEIARARIAHVAANDDQPNLFGETA